jgi:hypothetical protein
MVASASACAIYLRQGFGGQEASAHEEALLVFVPVTACSGGCSFSATKRASTLSRMIRAQMKTLSSVPLWKWVRPGFMLSHDEAENGHGVHISDRTGSRHQGIFPELAVLREKWPLAFPAAPQDVPPLAIVAAREIAAAMGWPLPYTLGVLASWKVAPVYCQATLDCDQRIALDGAPAEAVDAAAKDLAAKQLAKLAARKAAKKAAKTSAPAMVTPPPAPAPPPETPEQLRARIRASLLRRSA